MPPVFDYIDTIVRNRDTMIPVMVAKRMLIEQFGIVDGFAIYRERMSHLPDRGELRRKPLMNLREGAQQYGAAYHQTSVGKAFTVPAPRVIGDGERRALHGRSRSMFVTCLIDARVRARSGVIEVDDVALFDREGDEWNLFDDQLDFDASIFTTTEEGAWIIAPSDSRGTIELEEAFTLLGIRPYNFGHWLCEHLTRYVAATLTGALPSVPILVEAGMPPSHHEALQLMLPEKVPVVELPAYASAQVRRLWCTPNQALFSVFDIQNERFKWDDVALPPPVYAPILREMTGRARKAAAADVVAERVFLARRPGGDHALVNGAAIEAAAERRGFRLVYPEDLSFGEQIRMLEHARFVIGQSGSALHLVAFANPGTRLCILACSEDILATQCEYNAVLDGVGIETTILSGLSETSAEPAWRSDFLIDELEFDRFLDGWLRE